MGRFGRLMTSGLLAAVAFTVLFTSGCNPAKSHLAEFDRVFLSGDYVKAAEFAEKHLHDSGSPRGEDALWAMQLGVVERIQENHELSNQYFDSAEEMMSHYALNESKVGESIGSVVVNDNIIPYTGQTYDGVMVNTYKAMNFIALGKDDLARVEFNRALDRQRRAKEQFNQEIQKLQDDVQKDENSKDVQKSMDNPDLKTKLEQTYPNLYNFSVYPDFVNPFATYMAGIYFTAVGDYPKAVDLLKESAGMMPDNSFLLEDLAAVEQAMNTVGGIKPTVWVIFENGLGPIKDEVRLDLPLFIFTDRVYYSGIALPKLVFRPEALPYLVVGASGQMYNTQLVSDMDSVVQTEFNKEFQGILTRAIISATAKAVAQYSMSNSNSDGSAWAALFMAAYTAMTTTADVRIWTTLPKNFQAARFEKPADGKIVLNLPIGGPSEIQLPDCRHAVVYVKIITRELEPSIGIMTF